MMNKQSFQELKFDLEIANKSFSIFEKKLKNLGVEVSYQTRADHQLKVDNIKNKMMAKRRGSSWKK